MNNQYVRSAIPEDAQKIAGLWIQRTLIVASLESVYTPAVDQEKLADILKVELAACRRFAWVVMQNELLACYVTCRIEEELPLFIQRRYLYPKPSHSRVFFLITI